MPMDLGLSSAEAFGLERHAHEDDGNFLRQDDYSTRFESRADAFPTSRSTNGEAGPGKFDQAGFAALHSFADSAPATLAELEAEIAERPEYYGVDAQRLAGPLRPIDPAAPDYHQQVRERMAAAARLDASPGHDALSRLLRENFARLTEQMVAQLGPSRRPLT